MTGLMHGEAFLVHALEVGRRLALGVPVPQVSSGVPRVDRDRPGGTVPEGGAAGLDIG